MSPKQARKISEPAPQPVLPVDDAAADALLKEYGENVNALAQLAVTLDADLAAVKLTHETAAAPHQARLVEIFGTLDLYGALHRKRLTDDGKTKTVEMPAGAFGWRKNPPSVKVKSGKKLDDVIAEIREARLPRFLRRVWSLNKQALLADPEGAKKLKTVKIISGDEEFFVAPFGAELAEPK